MQGEEAGVGAAYGEEEEGQAVEWQAQEVKQAKGEGEAGPGRVVGRGRPPAETGPTWAPTGIRQGQDMAAAQT